MPLSGQSGSRNGTTVAFLEGVFGGSFVGTTSSSTKSLEGGSLYGTILDVLLELVPNELEPEATRRVPAAFFNVVPAAFCISGTFSLTRDLRVPISGYDMRDSSWGSEPVGSTKIWRRELETDLDPDPRTLPCDDDGARPSPRDPEDEDAVTPKTVRLVDGSGTGGGGIATLHIIRF